MIADAGSKQQRIDEIRKLIAFFAKRQDKATPDTDPRKWVLSWTASAPDGIAGTELSTEPFETHAVEATPYELALLACDIELNDETLVRLATTPVAPAPLTMPAMLPNILNTPPASPASSLGETSDITAQPSDAKCTTTWW